jgi:hypothetical protein
MSGGGLGLARDYAARAGYPKEMPVTEAEWLVCKDPFRMLNHLAVRTRSWPARLLRWFVFLQVVSP